MAAHAVGTRAARRGSGPFSGAGGALVLAAIYALAAAVVAIAGGGRWPVVHLLTLGVMTNLVVVFTQQISRAVTRSHLRLPPWVPVSLNAAIVGVVLSGMSGWRWGIPAAATAVAAIVFGSYVVLRRMRRAAQQVRFAWLVRAYERAHAAFLHGAILGALMGAAVLPGPWHGTARLAHLHVNLGGWIGLTLAATLLFFAPAMLRTRMPQAAEAVAVPKLRRGATGLTVGVLALLCSALPSPYGVAARLLAAAGLAVYAAGIVSVARVTLEAARTQGRSAVRGILATAALWFAFVAVADTVVVAAGAWRWLDAIGVAFAAGVVLPSVLAVALHLLPMLRGRGFAARAQLLARTERAAGVRVIALNVAAVLVSAGVMLGATTGAAAWRAGWGIAAAVVIWTAMLAALPVTPLEDDVGMQRPTLPVVDGATSARS